MSIIRGVMGVGGKPDDSELTPVGAILFFPLVFGTIYGVTHIDSWYAVFVLPAMALVAIVIISIEKYCYSLFERWKSK